MNKKFATRLMDMPLVTSEGTMIGRLDDIIINDQTGDIFELLINPTGEKITHFKKDVKGRYVVPYEFVKMGKDVFVIELQRVPKLD
ncbi:MAG: PRC-barrel domain-containing protein [Candidatus Thermoplasmatota archaeon]|jgi:sporulation protein YlmC with PRC-barrel domain|nr:PRC-barrel domain-containing protein [Candidatus Thermoplasmatota archaeon]